MSVSALWVKEKMELEINVLDQEWEQVCENGHKLDMTLFSISKFDKTKTNF